MGTVLFDFDSTLVPCESLEEVLRAAEGLSPERAREIGDLTLAGMEGRLSFEDSLRRRLALARPTADAVDRLARALAVDTSAGADRLVGALQQAGHQVWIVSGGLQEILETVGSALGIARHRIHGVTCRWREDGSLEAVDETTGFATSKVEGLRRLGPALERPAVGVGDGATDLALRAAGFVDHFVAYTEHAAREGVIAEADATAGNMAELGPVLAKLLA